jgi:hypothetical protein
MRRAALAVLFSCVAASAGLYAGPSPAGDYDRYDAAYAYRSYHSEDVLYSSACCYRRVLRQETSVGYAPERYGYGDRVYGYGYVARPYADYPYYRSYAATEWRDAGPAEVCELRRTRIIDGRGGWVWGVRRVCY